MAFGEVASLPVGTIVSKRYQILRVVGQGGLGTVYQVSDDTLGMRNIYALKELADQSSGARKQFEQEAKWLRALDHRNIPKVREYFDWRERLYLVMDFVDGENLDEKLRRLGGRGIPEAEVIGWTLPICDALQYLHRQRPPILHRDVKPANIIVTPNGYPVLVDLGIAKEHRPGMNQTATFVRKAGTEGYAPPEQYTAAGQAGPWSDVYGLGATLYELLTGCIPPTALERVALDVRLMRPREVNPVISEGVSNAIMRALAIRPADRYQVMSDFAAALWPSDFAPSDFAAQPGSYPPARGMSAGMSAGMSPSASTAPVPSAPLQWSPATPRVGGSVASTPPGSLPGMAPPGSSNHNGNNNSNNNGRMSFGSAPGAPPSAPQSAPWGMTQEAPQGTSPGALQIPTPIQFPPAKRRARRNTGNGPPLDMTPAPAADEGEAPARRWYSYPLVWVGAVVALLAIAALVSVFVFGLFAPIDRSSPQATITGYFKALMAQDDSRAWQYAAGSRNDLAMESSFLANLKTDDSIHGRVLSAQIIQVDNANIGQAQATVAVTRANAPDAPITYTLVLTQYDGTTWLIDSISS